MPLFSTPTNPSTHTPNTTQTAQPTGWKLLETSISGKPADLNHDRPFGALGPNSSSFYLAIKVSRVKPRHSSTSNAPPYTPASKEEEEEFNIKFHVPPALLDICVCVDNERPPPFFELCPRDINASAVGGRTTVRLGKRLSPPLGLCDQVRNGPKANPKENSDEDFVAEEDKTSRNLTPRRNPCYPHFARRSFLKQRHWTLPQRRAAGSFLLLICRPLSYLASVSLPEGRGCFTRREGTPRYRQYFTSHLQGSTDRRLTPPDYFSMSAWTKRWGRSS